MPRRVDAPLDLLGEALDREALLRERVGVAQRDRAVLERRVIDRHAEGRADLVLAAIAPADRAALVVLALHPPADLPVHLARELGLVVLCHQGKHGGLHRREAGMQAPSRALLALARALALEQPPVGRGDA